MERNRKLYSIRRPNIVLYQCSFGMLNYSTLLFVIYKNNMCLNLSKRVIKFLISNWYSLFGFVRSKYSTKLNGGWEGKGIQLYTCIHLVNKLTIYNAKCKFYIVNIIVHFVNANFGRINFKTIDNIKRPTQRVTANFFHWID